MNVHLIISDRFIIQSPEEMSSLLKGLLKSGARVSIYSEQHNLGEKFDYKQHPCFIVLANYFYDRLHFISVPTIKEQLFDFSDFLRNTDREHYYFLSEHLIEAKPTRSEDYPQIKQYFYTAPTDFGFVKAIISSLTNIKSTAIFPKWENDNPGIFCFKTPIETSAEKNSLLKSDLETIVKNRKIKKDIPVPHFGFFGSCLASQYDALTDLPTFSNETKSEMNEQYHNPILQSLSPTLENAMVYPSSCLAALLNKVVSTLNLEDKYRLLRILLKTTYSDNRVPYYNSQYCEVIENLIESMPFHEHTKLLSILLEYSSWSLADPSIQEILFTFYNKNQFSAEETDKIVNIKTSYIDKLLSNSELDETIFKILLLCKSDISKSEVNTQAILNKIKKMLNGEEKAEEKQTSALNNILTLSQLHMHMKLISCENIPQDLQREHFCHVNKIYQELLANFRANNYNFLNDHRHGSCLFEKINQLILIIPANRLANIAFVLIKYIEGHIVQTQKHSWQYLERVCISLHRVIRNLSADDIPLLKLLLPNLMTLILLRDAPRYNSRIETISQEVLMLRLNINRDAHRYNSRIETISQEVLMLLLNKSLSLLLDDDKKFLAEFAFEKIKNPPQSVEYAEILLNIATQIEDHKYREQLVKRLERLCCNDKLEAVPYYLNMAKNSFTSCSLVLSHINKIKSEVESLDMPPEINKIISSYAI